MAKKDLSAGFGSLGKLPPEREKPAVDEAALAKFVATKPKAPAQERRIGPTKRRAGAGSRINVILPFDVEDRLREQAFKERRSMSDAITEAIEAWLKSR